MADILKIADGLWRGELDTTQYHPFGHVDDLSEVGDRSGFVASFANVSAFDTDAGLAGLGETYDVIPSYRAGITSRQAGLLADAATRKALELDESLPEAHVARADFFTCAWKWRERCSAVAVSRRPTSRSGLK